MLMDGLFLFLFIFMIMAVMDGHLMLFRLATVIMRAVAVIELRETLHPTTIADVTAMQAHHLSAQQGEQEEEPMEELKHGGEYFDSSGDCRALFWRELLSKPRRLWRASRGTIQQTSECPDECAWWV